MSTAPMVNNKPKLTKPVVRSYGSVLAVILSKISHPGDGVYGKGVKGGGS